MCTFATLHNILYFGRNLCFFFVTDKIFEDQICINTDCRHGICRIWKRHSYRIFLKVNTWVIFIMILIYTTILWHLWFNQLLIFSLKHKFIANSIFSRLDWRNLITYCYIHNDSTVELSKCGTMVASFEVAGKRKVIGKREIMCTFVQIFISEEQIIFYIKGQQFFNIFSQKLGLNAFLRIFETRRR